MAEITSLKDALRALFDKAAPTGTIGRGPLPGTGLTLARHR